MLQPNPQHSESVLVIVPTYDERENIETTLTRLRAAVPHGHVLVVDDASPDGTGLLAERWAAHDHHVHVLHRAGKEGLGAAYLAGFRWGLAAGYALLVEMDADGSHAPEDLPQLLEVARDADVVLGSRWMPGGQVSHWSRSRELLSRGGNAYARVALGVPLQDITGGYRVYRRHVLEAIDLDAVQSQGYCFQIDLAWRAIRGGYTVAETPITFTDREFGQSKMGGSIVREALLRVTLWGAQYRLAQVVGQLRSPIRHARTPRLGVMYQTR